jgi:hypothetical protein
LLFENIKNKNIKNYYIINKRIESKSLERNRSDGTENIEAEIQKQL